MDPRQLLFDERLKGGCVYCGARPETKDHVPSRVFLDKPFPADLPTVAACKSCNDSFSLDEQYVACFIDAVMSGTAEPAEVIRDNVRRILAGNIALASRIRNCRMTDDAGNYAWQPEVDRFRRIIVKLARGHIAYELFANREEPSYVSFSPLLTLSDTDRLHFEDEPFGNLDLCPEIGTRAFHRACIGVYPGQHPVPLGENWIVVQPNRYRYSVSQNGLGVRMVLSEYLAAKVTWV